MKVSVTASLLVTRYISVKRSVLVYESLISFLDSLPNTVPILFDLRNANTYCLEELFEEFTNQKNMYFFGQKTMIEAKSFMDYIEKEIEKGNHVNNSKYNKYLGIKSYYNKRTESKRYFLNRLGIISELGINP